MKTLNYVFKVWATVLLVSPLLLVLFIMQNDFKGGITSEDAVKRSRRTSFRSPAERSAGGNEAGPRRDGGGDEAGSAIGSGCVGGEELA